MTVSNHVAVYDGPAAVEASRALPRDVFAFTGRLTELRMLTAGSVPRSSADDESAVFAVDGMAGAGKTALAVRAAHQLADAYPDGQLFIRLHAHTAGRPPVSSADALGALLVAIGVNPQQIPVGGDERAALWRHSLSGRRFLVVLDDATGHDQVRPLLPGTDDSLVIVTSRRRLSALPEAVPISLGMLPATEAVALLARLSGRSGAEDAAAQRIAALCGYLPLALALLAGKLRHHPTWSMTDLEDDILAAKDRLGEIEAEDVTIVAAFASSVSELSLDRLEFFRLLGLHPGTEIGEAAAASLADLPSATARRHLNALYSDHLLEEPVRGRYRMHDLIRAYVRSMTLSARPGTASNAEPEGSTLWADMAERRLLAHYGNMAALSSLHFTPLVEEPGIAVGVPHSGALTSQNTAPPAAPEGSPVAGPTTRHDALVWLRTERANLLACAARAAETGDHLWVARLSSSLHPFFRQEGPWDHAAALHRMVAAQARSDGRSADEAVSLNYLGDIYRLTGELRAAGEAVESAYVLHTAAGNRHGQALSLHHRGELQRIQGEHVAAEISFMQSLALNRAIGYQHGEADLLAHLGHNSEQAGDLTAAENSLLAALQLARGLDNLHAEGDTLQHLGQVYRRMGQLDTATAHLSRACEIHRHLGHRFGEANSLRDLADVHALAGDLTAAFGALDTALQIHRTLGGRLAQAECLNAIGELLLKTSRLDPAATRFGEALQLANEAANPPQEARARTGLEACTRRTTAGPGSLSE
ncbi:tetratricopeptide repeat protein [Streptomyces sp. NPDC090083]|uniref:tetratricopeptide repeat protein n=1 Tax=Streptomyces sp. NPDC090083 TaxID=3365941 RepID=UPI003802160F